MQYKKIIEISDFENNKRIPLSSLERQRLKKNTHTMVPKGLLIKSKAIFLMVIIYLLQKMVRILVQEKIIFRDLQMENFGLTIMPIF